MIGFEINTIEDCINILDKRNDIPLEIVEELRDIWGNILENQNYENDFALEKAIRKLENFINGKE